MNWRIVLHRIRFCLAVASGVIIAGGTWGFVLAIIAKSVFSLSENQALLFVGVPAGVLIAILIWPKMPKIMGFDQE